MVGAIIGAVANIGSSIYNAIKTSQANKKRKDALNARLAANRSQEVTDRYGDWKYSAGNMYFNKAFDAYKEAQQNARGLTNTTGKKISTDYGKGLADAAGQANAQRQALGMEMAQQDRAQAEDIQNKIDGIDAENSAAQTAAISQIGSAAGNLAAAIDGPTDSGKKANAAKTVTSNGNAAVLANTAPQSIEQNIGKNFQDSLSAGQDFVRKLKGV